MARPKARRPLADALAGDPKVCRICGYPDDVRSEIDRYLLGVVEERRTNPKASIKWKGLRLWINDEAGLYCTEHNIREHLTCLARS